MNNTANHLGFEQSASFGSTKRDLNTDEIDAVSGGLYFEAGRFRFTTLSSGWYATWDGGAGNGGWGAGVIGGNAFIER